MKVIDYFLAPIRFAFQIFFAILGLLIVVACVLMVAYFCKVLIEEIKDKSIESWWKK